MFGASGLFFFVFFGACQGFVKSESPNLHRHQTKEKNQTTRCTKPAQAPKKLKNNQEKTQRKTKIKNPGTVGPLLSSCRNFCFFWYLSMFGASSGLFFLFFWCLSMFLFTPCQHHDEKMCFTKVSDPPNASNTGV